MDFVQKPYHLSKQHEISLKVAVLLNQRALLGRTRIATIIQAWSSP
ncbi:hypothetical protein SLEP1_g17294 [Rubroshorea leprosula]|uniref:Transposase n=1 Tax=Rubroshorea leprosula TaxID=152421 RepID=A0AAV5IZM8_9ROSI|nr:hypothetical protein SLEP1_g17294 [Rubroshorea leprosula]